MSLTAQEEEGACAAAKRPSLYRLPRSVCRGAQVTVEPCYRPALTIELILAFGEAVPLARIQDQLRDAAATPHCFDDLPTFGHGYARVIGALENQEWCPDGRGTSERGALAHQRLVGRERSHLPSQVGPEERIGCPCKGEDRADAEKVHAGRPPVRRESECRQGEVAPVASPCDADAIARDVAA